MICQEGNWNKQEAKDKNQEDGRPIAAIVLCQRKATGWAGVIQGEIEEARLIQAALTAFWAFAGQSLF